MPDRTTFQFLAYRTLRHTLGVTDATVEAAELAILEFIRQSELAPEPDAYLQLLSRRFGVRVDTVDNVQLLHTNRRLYIVAVYSQYSEFLERFRDHHPGRNTWVYP